MTLTQTIHTEEVVPSEKDLERLWSRITKTETCWLWDKPWTTGYGKLAWGGRQGVGAHRIVYELIKGKIPEGLFIDHLCRVRNCVNPDHLEPVTHEENIRRGIGGVNAINRAKTHCLKGHPLSGENMQMRNGARVCLTCSRRYGREAYRRKHANIAEEAYQRGYKEGYEAGVKSAQTTLIEAIKV